MERILILMQAANWAEATEALTSARENALHRNALSYALVLPEAPTSPEECNMAADAGVYGTEGQTESKQLQKFTASDLM